LETHKNTAIDDAGRGINVIGDIFALVPLIISKIEGNKERSGSLGISMMQIEITQYWQQAFDAVTPKAYNLKHVFKNRWVRFHSLPQSKRYPDNEAEYAEVLRRHNLVLQELWGNTCRLWVVLSEYSEAQLPSNPDSKLARLFPASMPWCYFEQHTEGDDGAWYCHLHVTELTYSGTELNSLFRLVANDEVDNIMLINPATGIVFHPYDGGADVVLASTKQRDQLKEKYQLWLSDHPDGY